MSDVTRYHKPGPAEVLAHEALSKAAEDLIVVILNRVPECADRSEAIRAVRAAKMWASAAVALEGKI